MKLPEFIIARIKEANQRLTRQKEKVLEVLVKNEDRMMSVQDIKQRISQNDKMDDATIYRNLSAFVDIGIVEQSMDTGGIGRFKLRCEQGHHHHFICQTCGKVYPFPCDDSFIRSIAETYGFQESYHKLEIFGKCKECLNKD